MLSKLYIKEDLIIKRLEDYGFKYNKTEKKEIYIGNGLEIDIETREVKSIGKSNLGLVLKMYEDNILIIK